MKRWLRLLRMLVLGVKVRDAIEILAVDVASGSVMKGKPGAPPPVVEDSPAIREQVRNGMMQSDGLEPGEGYW